MCITPSGGIADTVPLLTLRIAYFMIDISSMNVPSPLLIVTVRAHLMIAIARKHVIQVLECLRKRVAAATAQLDCIRLVGAFG